MAHEVVKAVVLSVAVLVAGVFARWLGRWVGRTLRREFHSAVDGNHGLQRIAEAVERMRDEQTVQHGQVRQDVADLSRQVGLVEQRLELHVDAVDARLDRIERRIYPPTD